MEGEFKPSLTGNQQYRAQALDVIVAAFSLPHVVEISKRKKGVQFVEQDTEYENVKYGMELGSDLLTAASHALLGDKT
jgi:hypothetical protein